MRLLSTKTLHLEEFHEGNTPEYAILSHTWDGAEINLQDWEAGHGTGSAGHNKVLRFCEVVKDEFEWCWLDTICIDKKSSADLSEATNSMFLWYKEAQICIVYLSDVEISDDRGETLQRFERSRWFTRGWTLQELLAPRKALFLDKNWVFIGAKDMLIANLVAATQIPSLFLENNGHRVLRGASVAQKMSWASKRQTTRIEDLAYCLMGIFEINMPLLYGERHKAFRRLQEEIIKTSEDESIFVWDDGIDLDLDELESDSCLAPAPICFRNCGTIVSAHNNNRNLRWDKPGYSLIKRKLELNAYIPHPPNSWPHKGASHFGEKIAAVLNCFDESGPAERYCNIILRYHASGLWQRVRNGSSPQSFSSVPKNVLDGIIEKQIYIRA